MVAIGCLVPETRSGAERKFSKNAMFVCCYSKLYCLHMLSCCIKLTCVLVKRQLESRQRYLNKTAVAVRIKFPLTRIQYLREVPGFHSADHRCGMAITLETLILI